MRAPHLLLLVGLALPGWAGGLDRDGVLTEAPAAPLAGTVRVAGAGNASWAGSTSGGVSASLLWAIFPGFAADLGAYWQDGAAGPTVRVRYQLLRQDEHQVDAAVGLRYRSEGLDPRNGELELLLAAGRRFGPLEVMLNLVGGAELGGAGLDVEVKALVGYRVLEVLRVGLDGRAQAEVHDEAGFKAPGLGADVALVGGAAVAWLPLPALQLELLVGAAKPRGTLGAAPTARLTAAFDF